MAIILGIETSTDACSVAIYTPEKIYGKYALQPQAHSKLLLDMVSEVLGRANISLLEVNALAFGRGPGSFTGVRIATSVIQGLAFGSNKPVLAISSLRAIAQQAFNKTLAKDLLVLSDAKMQEIYCGYYQVDKHGLVQATAADAILKPEQVIVDKSISYLAVGSAIKIYQNIIASNNPQLIFDQTIEYPRAQEIVQLAAQEFAKGKAVLAKDALPTYLRNDVAKKADKKNPD